MTEFFKESDKVRTMRSALLRFLNEAPRTSGQIVQYFRTKRIYDYPFWTNTDLGFVKKSLQKMGLVRYDRCTGLWERVAKEKGNPG